jgi:hypothetical protein
MPIGDRGESTKEHYDPDTGEWDDDFFEDEPEDEDEE